MVCGVIESQWAVPVLSLTEEGDLETHLATALEFVAAQRGESGGD